MDVAEVIACKSAIPGANMLLDQAIRDDFLKLRLVAGRSPEQVPHIQHKQVHSKGSRGS